MVHNSILTMKNASCLFAIYINRGMVYQQTEHNNHASSADYEAIKWNTYTIYRNYKHSYLPQIWKTKIIYDRENKGKQYKEAHMDSHFNKVIIFSSIKNK